MSAAASGAWAETTLRWKLVAGQKRNYVLTQTMVMKMEAMGKLIESNLTQTAEMTWPMPPLPSGA